jgi:hypothetical protein
MGFLVQLEERAVAEHVSRQSLAFGFGTIAPDDLRRLRQAR